MVKNISKNKIRVCALMLTPYDIHPGQRLRLEQWEPYLLEDGIQIDHFPLLDQEMLRVMYKEGKIVSKMIGMMRATFRRLGQIIKSRQYDAVYLYRGANIVGPAIFERILRLLGTPIIFDFDDAIYLSDSSDANRFFRWSKFPGKTSVICKLSNRVTVGNSYLRKYAQEFNKSVTIIPTSIDTQEYLPLNRNLIEGSKTIIGWTGTSSSQRHLDAFEPVLEKILTNPNLELLVISDRKPEFVNIDCRWEPWSSEREIDLISLIDIGIMPNPDDKWSRGKCAAKALQYMALGIPAICSNIGSNKEVIESGKNGFLAETEDEWVHFVGLLTNDLEKRRTLGSAARDTVVKRYSMKYSAKLFADVVVEVVNRR